MVDGEGDENVVAQKSAGGKKERLPVKRKEQCGKK